MFLPASIRTVEVPRVLWEEVFGTAEAGNLVALPGMDLVSGARSGQVLGTAGVLDVELALEIEFAVLTILGDE